MKTTKKLSLTVIFSVLFIAACGNKGDLFIPEKPGQDATEQTKSGEKKTKTS